MEDTRKVLPGSEATPEEKAATQRLSDQRHASEDRRRNPKKKEKKLKPEVESNPFADDNGQPVSGRENEYQTWNDAKKNSDRYLEKELALKEFEGNEAFQKVVNERYEGDAALAQQALYRANKYAIEQHRQGNTVSIDKKTGKKTVHGADYEKLEPTDDGAKYDWESWNLYSKENDPKADPYRHVKAVRENDNVLYRLKKQAGIVPGDDKGSGKDSGKGSSPHKPPKPSNLKNLVDNGMTEEQNLAYGSAMMQAADMSLGGVNPFGNEKAKQAPWGFPKDNDAYAKDLMGQRIVGPTGKPDPVVYENPTARWNYENLQGLYNAGVPWLTGAGADPELMRSGSRPVSVSFKDPDQAELELDEEALRSLRKLMLDRGLEGKVGKDQDLSIYEDFIFNGIMGEVNDEGLIEGLWNTIASPGSHFVPSISKEMDGLEGDPRFQAWKAAYIAGNMSIRTAMGLKNSMKLKPDASGTYTFDPAQLETYMKDAEDVGRAGLRGATGLISSNADTDPGQALIALTNPILAPFYAGKITYDAVKKMVSDDSEPEHKSGNGNVARYLTRPLSFLGKEHSSNAEIKELLFSRIKPEQKEVLGKYLETKDASLEPEVMEMIYDTGAEFAGSMLVPVGSFGAAGKTATFLMDKGRKAMPLITKTRYVKPAMEKATQLVNKLGIDKVVAGANKTKAGSKFLNFMSRVSQGAPEATAHTVLTFALANLYESGDEITQEELEHAILSGSLFGLTGAIGGTAFAELFGKFARRSKILRKITSEKAQEGKWSKEEIESIDAAMEARINRAKEIGFYAGQIPTNIMQGVAVNAIMDPNFDIWSDQQKVQTAQDIMISALFGRNYKKAIAQARKGKMNIDEMLHKVANEGEVRTQEQHYKKSYDKDANLDDLSPLADNGEVKVDIAVAEEEIAEAAGHEPEPQYTEYTTKEYAEKQGITPQAVRKAVAEGRLKGEKRGNRIIVMEPIEAEPVKEAEPVVEEQGPRPFDDFQGGTVRDVAERFSFAPDEMGAIEQILFDRVQDTPIEMHDGRDTYFNESDGKIYVGREALARDEQTATQQIMEEVQHAAVVPVLRENPELVENINRIIQKITDNPVMQNLIAMDRVASIRSGRGTKGRMEHYLQQEDPIKTAAEFIAGIRRGEMAGLDRAIDQAFGQNTFGKIIEGLGINKLSKEGVVTTPESISREVLDAFRQIQTAEIGQEAVTGETEYATWRSAAKAAGDTHKPTPTGIAIYKKLTDLAVEIGVPEPALLDMAREHYGSKHWESLSPEFRAQKTVEYASKTLKDNPVEFSKQERIYKAMEKLRDAVVETQDMPTDKSKVSHLIRNLGVAAGFTSTKNARNWLRKELEQKGFDGAYQSLKGRYDKQSGKMPKELKDYYDQAFDEAYAQLMLGDGWNEPTVSLNFEGVRATQFNVGAVKVKKTGAAEPLPARVTLGYARKALVKSMDRNYLRDGQRAILDVFDRQRFDTSESLADSFRTAYPAATIGDFESLREDLINNGYYLMPKGLHGPVLIDFEQAYRDTMSEISQIHGGRDEEGFLWHERPENAQKIVTGMERMVWHRVLDSDTAWKVDEKPADELLAALDLHAVLNAYRHGGFKDTNILEFFTDKSEGFKQNVKSRQDEAIETLNNVGAKLNEIMLSHGQQLAPMAELLAKKQQKVASKGEYFDKYGEHGVEMWEEAVRSQSRKLLRTALAHTYDQLSALMVDPGGASFFADKKMPAKYFNFVAGAGSYHSYKSGEHINQILRGAGHEQFKLDADGNITNSDSDLARMGLQRFPDGRVGHRVLVLSDAVAEQIPFLKQMTGNVPISEWFDGASMYINPETRRLHAGMLGKDADRVGGIKPAWYGYENDSLSLWKTGAHETFLDIMNSPDDNPALADFLKELAKNNIAMVTFESSLKSDGSFRYNRVPGKNGEINIIDHKGRFIGVEKNGKVKKLNDEEAAAKALEEVDNLMQGRPSDGMVKNIPITGEDGLRLVTAFDEVNKLNGVSNGLVSLPVTLSNDQLGTAYEALGPLIRNNNRRSLEIFNVGEQILAGEIPTDSVYKNQGLRDVYQALKREIASENNTLGKSWTDPLQQQLVLNLVDGLVDYTGKIDPDRYAKLNEMLPGMFSRANDAVPSMIERIIARNMEDGHTSRMDGAGQLWLQPIGSPKQYMRNGAEYIKEVFKDPTEQLERLKMMETLMKEGGEYDGVKVESFLDENGREREYHPYVFVTQDYLDAANDKIYEMNQSLPVDQKLEYLAPGSKTLMVLTPTDSAGSHAAVIIAGVMGGKNKLSASNGILRLTQGRDYDGDGEGLAFNSDRWIGADGRNTFDDYWKELYGAKTHDASAVKPMETALKRGAAANAFEFDKGNVARAVDHQGVPVSATYVPQKPSDAQYGARALQAAENSIGMGMDSQRRTVAAMRLANGRGQYGKGSRLDVTFDHDPKMNSQLSVWRQAQVDPYDPHSYDWNDVYMSSIIKDLNYKGKPSSYNQLPADAKDDVKTYFKDFLKDYGPPSKLTEAATLSNVDPRFIDSTAGALEGQYQTTLKGMQNKQPLSPWHDFLAQSVAALKTRIRSGRTVKDHSESMHNTLGEILAAEAKESRVEGLFSKHRDVETVFNDYMTTLNRASGKDGHQAFNRAVAGFENEKMDIANQAILSSVFRRGAYRAERGVNATIGKAVLKSESGELFLSAGEQTENVSEVFDTNGRIKEEYKAVFGEIRPEDVYNAAMGPVIVTTFLNKQNRFKALPQNNPKKFYIYQDSPEWSVKGYETTNVATLPARPKKSAADSRSVRKAAEKAYVWLRQNPDGQIIVNQTIHKEAFQKDIDELLAALQKGSDYLGLPAKALTTTRLDKESMGLMLGDMAGTMAQAVTQDPAQASFLAGHLITQAYRFKDKATDTSVRPTMGSFLSGAMSTGISPRHATGETLFTAVMNRNHKRFEDTLTEWDPHNEPVKKASVPSNEPLPKVEPNQKHHTWRGTADDGTAGLVPEFTYDAIVKSLGPRKYKRMLEVMKKLRSLNGGRLTLSQDEYERHEEDIRQVFSDAYGKDMSEKAIKDLFTVLGRGNFKSLQDSMTLYGDPLAQRTAGTVLMLQAAMAAEKQIQDAAVWMHRDDVAKIKRKWSRMWHTYLKPNARQSDRALHLVAGGMGTIYGSDVAYSAVSTIKNGETTTMVPVTVGMTYDPLLRVRNSAVYSDPVVMEYLDPQTHLHRIKDAAQYWVKEGSNQIQDLDPAPSEKHVSVKQKIKTELTGKAPESSIPDLSRSMTVLGRAIVGGEGFSKLDLSGLNITTEFDGSESRAKVTYGDESFEWSGNLSRLHVDAIQRIAGDIYGKTFEAGRDFELLSDQEKAGMPAALRRLLMTMINNKMLGNYAKAQSDNLAFWAQAKMADWNGTPEQKEELVQLVSEQLKRSQELVDLLSSDDPTVHHRLNMDYNVEHATELMTRFKDDIDAMYDSERPEIGEKMYAEFARMTIGMDPRYAHYFNDSPTSSRKHEVLYTDLTREHLEKTETKTVQEDPLDILFGAGTRTVTTEEGVERTSAPGLDRTTVTTQEKDFTKARDLYKKQVALGKALWHETMNKMAQDDIRVFAPIMGVDMPYAEINDGLPVDFSRRAMEFLATYYGDRLSYGLGSRQAFIEKSFDDNMLGMNNVMRTGYMAEYFDKDTMLGRHAALGRFDLDGYMYDREVDHGELYGKAMNKKGMLTEEDHNMETGQQMAISYVNDRGEIMRSAGKFYGITKIKTSTVLAPHVAQRAEEIKQKAPGRDPQADPDGPSTFDTQSWSEKLEEYSQDDSIPAAILYELDPIDQRGKFTIMPLSQIKSMHAGEKLSWMARKYDNHVKKRAKTALEELRGSMKDLGISAGEDPVAFIGKDFTKFITAYAQDPEMNLGYRYFGGKRNETQPRERVLGEFARTLHYEDASPGVQKLYNVAQKALGYPSMYLYGGHKHLIGALALGAAAIPAAVGLGTGAGVALGIAGGVAVSKLLATHLIHWMGNYAGGMTRAKMLDISGFNFSAIKRDMTPAVAASIANRFGGNGLFFQDAFQFSESNTGFTAPRERELIVMRNLQDAGVLSQTVRAETLNAARQQAISNIKKHTDLLDEFTLRGWRDPKTGEHRFRIMTKDNRTLHELEEMNLDALNVALTNVAMKQGDYIKNTLKAIGRGAGLAPKMANKINARMFYKVTESEYEGAVWLAKALDASYDTMVADMNGKKWTHDQQAVDRVLRHNYISTMQEEILGKFDERNPHHLKPMGRLATLFSQWSRNYFIQSTEGHLARQFLATEIHRDMMLDPVYSKNFNKMIDGVAVAGGISKSQLKAIRRQGVWGLVAKLPALASLINSVVAQINSEKADADIDKLAREAEDWTRYGERIIGADNPVGWSVLKSLEIASWLTALTLGDETAIGEWKEARQAQDALNNVSEFGRAFGAGVGGQLAYDIPYITQFASYIALTDKDYMWDNLGRDVLWRAKTAVMFGGGAPITAAIDVWEQADKALSKGKSGSKKRKKSP